jgi:hypothetical protein
MLRVGFCVGERVYSLSRRKVELPEYPAPWRTPSVMKVSTKMRDSGSSPIVPPFGGWAHNAMPITRAAVLDRENMRVLPDAKARLISLDAQRRRVERLVRMLHCHITRVGIRLSVR